MKVHNFFCDLSKFVEQYFKVPTGTNHCHVTQQIDWEKISIELHV
jgi:NADPH-dependent 7-cyano-7-deazaguanine reductase QueF